MRFFFVVILLLCLARMTRGQGVHALAEAEPEAEDEAEDEEEEPTLLESPNLEALDEEQDLEEPEHRRELKLSPGPTPGPTCPGSLSEDGAALCAFFDTLSTAAQHQLTVTGWTCDTTTSDPCAFKGVKCTSGRVTSLTVPPLRSGFEKYGPFVLPTEIGDLGCLKTLNLNGANFVGSIQSQLGALSLLTSLDLSNNAFTQDLPSQLSSLTRLVKFDISKNNLESSLPAALCTSTALKAQPQNPQATLCQSCSKGQPGGGFPACPH